MASSYKYLFLDRDGVINKWLVGTFVDKLENFELIPQAEEALVLLSQLFDRVVIVTNQRCIDEGIVEKKDLLKIHQYLEDRILELGGKMDAVYFCPHAKIAQCKCRKPELGMAYQAQADFPEIRFEQSIIVGDSMTDLEFGRKLEMHTVLILGKGEEIQPELVDDTFETLWDFAQNWQKNHLSIE